MNFSKNLMAMMAATNAVTKPTIKKLSWLEEKRWMFLNKSKPVAAAMVGMAKRKENSTMAAREIPKIRPPTIVAALREMPGIMATDWNRPMSKACG